MGKHKLAFLLNYISYWWYLNESDYWLLTTAELQWREILKSWILFLESYFQSWNNDQLYLAECGNFTIKIIVIFYAWIIICDCGLWIVNCEYIKGNVKRRQKQTIMNGNFMDFLSSIVQPTNQFLFINWKYLLK